MKYGGKGDNDGEEDVEEGASERGKFHIARAHLLLRMIFLAENREPLEPRS